MKIILLNGDENIVAYLNALIEKYDALLTYARGGRKKKTLNELPRRLRRGIKPEDIKTGVVPRKDRSC
ncbi:MAG: hypothetical protein LBL07_12440 [Tannerella sp.]|nr:hypothetical protein [Tannerella sp.]